MTETGSGFVTVAVAGNTTEAGLYQATLEQAGIPAFIADEGIVSLNWFLSNAVGGIKIQVPAEHASEAREVLGTAAVAVDPEDVERLECPPVTCPRCASSDVRAYTGAQGRNVLTSLASFFLLPVPVPLRETRLHCRACGRVFRKP